MWSNSEKMAKNAYEFLFRQTEASKQRQSVPENPKKIGSICPDELIRLEPSMRFLYSFLLRLFQITLSVNQVFMLEEVGEYPMSTGANSIAALAIRYF